MRISGQVETLGMLVVLVLLVDTVLVVLVVESIAKHRQYLHPSRLYSLTGPLPGLHLQHDQFSSRPCHQARAAEAG